jgi:hypothetical protein
MTPVEQKKRSEGGSGGRGYANRVRLLSSRFRYADQSGLCGQARLYPDRIELTTWHLHGRETRVVRLTSVTFVDYHALERGSNLSLYLESGETLCLNVKKAHLWRHYFENWLRYTVLASAKLVSGQDEALALSG